MIERRHELGLQVCDEPELVMLYDDHADSFTLLASALLAAAPPGSPSPSNPNPRPLTLTLSLTLPLTP